MITADVYGPVADCGCLTLNGSPVCELVPRLVPGELTLGQREQISGRDLTQDDGDGLYCVDCLADLPGGVWQLQHVCGHPVLGDLVWVVVDVPAGYGRLFTVGAVSGCRVRIYDVGDALDVSPADVILIEPARDGS